jgi:glutathionylspermidine synthase
MPILEKVKPLRAQDLAEAGYDWFDEEYQCAGEMVVLTEGETDAYLEAAEELYEMFVETGEEIIERNLLPEFGFPQEMNELIRDSWERDENWHIYGRFDLAGGLDGLPIKMLEFNADTATLVCEVAVVQWLQAKGNNLDEGAQANDLFEALRDQYAKVASLNPGLERRLLTTCFESTEDFATCKLMEMAASEADFETGFEDIEVVTFSPDGIFTLEPTVQWPFLYKLVPWEMIAFEEPELLRLLSSAIKSGSTMVVNPAYTLLFQHKRFLEKVYRKFPHCPYLLQTSSEPIAGPWVRKPVLGREGKNIEIRDHAGIVIGADGGYGDQQMIYQELGRFAEDQLGRKYQAGVFFAGRPAGLGFRRDTGIHSDRSQFVGHIIQ